MKPLDQVTPSHPSNRLRRVEERRRKRDGERDTDDRRQPPPDKPAGGPAPDGRQHIIDELA